MNKNIYKKQECDYCGSKNEIVRPSPFMTDAGSMMCKICWDMTKEEYMDSNGEYIPDFEDGPGYELIEDKQYIDSKEAWKLAQD